jgi:hypothetical protein
MEEGFSNNPNSSSNPKQGKSTNQSRKIYDGDAVVLVSSNNFCAPPRSPRPNLGLGLVWPLDLAENKPILWILAITNFQLAIAFIE